MKTSVKTREQLEKTVRSYEDAHKFTLSVQKSLAKIRPNYNAARSRLREMDKSDAARNEEPERTVLYRLIGDNEYWTVLDRGRGFAVEWYRGNCNRIAPKHRDSWVEFVARLSAGCEGQNSDHLPEIVKQQMRRYFPEL